MKFSFIIPVYNAEKGLQRCVKSIHAQLEDGEIILVDDGSTDNSGAICDELAETHEHVRVIHQNNHGALLTRRVGMMVSQGEYLLFPDADDYLEAGAIQDICNAINEFHPDMICYDWKRVDAVSSKSRIVHQLPGCADGSVQAMDVETVRMQIATDNTAGTLNAKAIRRELLDLNEDYAAWGNTICVSNDLFQVLPFIDATNSVVYICKPLYVYEKTAGSITMSYKPEKLYSYLEVMKRRDFYLEKWGIDEKLRLAAKIRTLGAVSTLLSGAYYAECNQQKYGALAAAVNNISSSQELVQTYKEAVSSKQRMNRKTHIELMLAIHRWILPLKLFLRMKIKNI